ncbi:hypothetical protein O6H91_Y437600 [Diphasiastrum complanatum]|nr:hypothetical protein O6H91_Y437600 [Diphasiastrum complanatum]
MKYAERIRRIQKRRAAGLPKSRFALQVQMKKPKTECLTHATSDSFQTTDVLYSPAAGREECSNEFENILSLGVQSDDCSSGISEAAHSKDDDHEQQYDNECMRSLLKVLRSWEQKQECKRRRYSNLAVEVGNRNVMEVCAEALAQLQPEVQEEILALI